MSGGQYSSQLLDNAVQQFAKLPGIGKKTALRLVLHLLRQEKEEVALFTEAVRAVRNDIRYCHVCRNISDTDTCDICANERRDHRTICVVETVRDVMAIESTHQYNGVYHVLGGVISPMDGIGPEDLEIAALEQRIAAKEADEVILALSTTMEGDTTNFFIFKKIAPYGIKVSTIARGVAVGDELEYADEVTLGRSIVNRVPFEQTT
ncbi:MAG: recombination mediator RecR [Marinilabiliaceae bacterium]|nr:recombination mediator RecR [Bacteroidales bacterium]